MAAAPSRRRRARIARLTVPGAICATRAQLSRVGAIPSPCSARSSSCSRNGLPPVATRQARANSLAALARRAIARSARSSPARRARPGGAPCRRGRARRTPAAPRWRPRRRAWRRRSRQRELPRRAARGRSGNAIDAPSAQCASSIAISSGRSAARFADEPVQAVQHGAGVRRRRRRPAPSSRAPAAARPRRPASQRSRSPASIAASGPLEELTHDAVGEVPLELAAARAQHAHAGGGRAARSRAPAGRTCRFRPRPRARRPTPPRDGRRERRARALDHTRIRARAARRSDRCRCPSSSDSPRSLHQKSRVPPRRRHATDRCRIDRTPAITTEEDDMRRRRYIATALAGDHRRRAPPGRGAAKTARSRSFTAACSSSPRASRTRAWCSSAFPRARRPFGKGLHYSTITVTPSSPTQRQHHRALQELLQRRHRCAVRSR